MEKPTTIERKETLPSRTIEYSKIVDTVYLSLAREADFPGALELSSFRQLMSEYSNTERVQIEEDLAGEDGVKFDETIVGLISVCMSFGRQSLIVEAREGEGVFGTNEFPWNKEANIRVKQLKASNAIPGDAEFSIVVKAAPELISEENAIASAEVRNGEVSATTADEAMAA